MAPAEHFPLTYPGEDRRTAAIEEALRRTVKVAVFGNGSRVLYWGCGSSNAAAVMAQEFGCTVVAADWDAVAVAKVEERVSGSRPTLRVETREVTRATLPFTDNQFEGVYVDDRIPQPLGSLLGTARRLLVPRGRVCLRYPVRVGRVAEPHVMQFWEKKLGEPLRRPREFLRLLEESGYEPISIETESDSELEDFYRTVEYSLITTEGAVRKALEEEIALYRAMAGRSSVTFARVIGRRKEPGEKPPASRNE